MTLSQAYLAEAAEFERWRVRHGLECQHYATHALSVTSEQGIIDAALRRLGELGYDRDDELRQAKARLKIEMGIML